jgi:hypothetical protein
MNEFPLLAKSLFQLANNRIGSFDDSIYQMRMEPSCSRIQTERIVDK